MGRGTGKAEIDEGTYFIEGEHLACHLAAVDEGDSHAVVDEVLHFALFGGHGCGVAPQAT